MPSRRRDSRDSSMQKLVIRAILLALTRKYSVSSRSSGTPSIFTSASTPLFISFSSSLGASSGFLAWIAEKGLVNTVMSSQSLVEVNQAI